MSEMDAGAQPNGAASRALSCAACNRLGGALYIFAYYGKCKDLYLRVDAGISAGIISAVRGTLNVKAVEFASSACRRLPQSYVGPTDIGDFVRAGMALFGTVLDGMNGEGPERPYEEVFAEAVALAGQWPGNQLVRGGTTPADFERSCQSSSVEHARGGDVQKVRELAGAAALEFRGLATAVLADRQS